MKRKVDDHQNQSLSKVIYQNVHEGNHKLLKTLLSGANSSDVNYKSKYAYFTPLDLAVFKNDLTATTLLLDHGAIPDCDRSQSGITSLEYRQIDSIDSDALLNCKFIPNLYRIRCQWSPNTLYTAIQRKNYDMIKLLIDRGCNPDMNLEWENNCNYSIPYNCWYKIIEEYDLHMFEFLVKCTGREIGENHWSQLMLLMACATNSKKIVFYLLDKGVQPVDNQLHGLPNTFRALIGQDVDIISRLLHRGAPDLHFKDSNGLSLLHLAVHLRDLEPLRLLLLDAGLPVDSRDNHNCTPLHYAVRSDEFIDAVDFLLSRGADINAVDNSGRTPIITAFKLNENDSIIDLLLEEGIIFDEPDADGLTLLHYLTIRCDLTEYNILYQPETDINVRDKNGMTPLHYAFMKNHENVHVLMGLGADTGAIRDCKEVLLKDSFTLGVLHFLQLSRIFADFPDDENINAILSEQTLVDFSAESYYDHSSSFRKTVKRMKKKKLLGRLTYFDFLHAKRRFSIAVAKIPGMKDIFYARTHRFHCFAYDLEKSYNNGLKPITEEEKEAITLVEDNLNVVFNGFLPNLVIHQIKKYIEIEDMVTVQRIVNVLQQ